MESGDPRIPDLCRPEHSSLAEVRILPEKKSIGHDGADQGGYPRGYKVFFRFEGAGEVKNRPKDTPWPHLPPAIFYRRLDLQLF